MVDSFERGTSARLSFANFARKLGSFRSKEYNKVEDLHDTRIPLHNEDAFDHGLIFKAKYVGSLEIARPTCKVDIITAMRRIRYEYKVKGIRKARCLIQISTSGVRVSKRKSKRRKKNYTDEQLFIMQHPIFRIFYVSHDSQDLKIFSYISREMPNNTFRCNVFKAFKKNMALHIVRSLGQAFDVCHKLNPKPKKKKDEVKLEKSTEDDGDKTETKETEKTADDTVTETPAAWKQFNTDLGDAFEGLNLDKAASDGQGKDTEMNLSRDIGFDPFVTVPPPVVGQQQLQSMANGGDLFGGDLLGDSVAVTYPPLTVGNATSLPDFPDGVDPSTMYIPPAHLAYLSKPGQSSSQQKQIITENPFTENRTSRDDSPISIGEALDDSHHHRKKSNPFKSVDEGGLRSQRHDIVFTAQITLLQEQLKAETAARLESQVRVEHLLTQNQELLSQMQKLMAQLSQIQMFHISQAAASGSLPKDSKPVSKFVTEPLAMSPSPQPVSEAYSSSSSSSSHSPSPDLPTVTASTYNERPPVIEEASAENEGDEEELISVQTPTVDLASANSSPATNDPFSPLSFEATQQALS